MAPPLPAPWSATQPPPAASAMAAAIAATTSGVRLFGAASAGPAATTLGDRAGAAGGSLVTTVSTNASVVATAAPTTLTRALAMELSLSPRTLARSAFQKSAQLAKRSSGFTATAFLKMASMSSDVTTPSMRGVGRVFSSADAYASWTRLSPLMGSLPEQISAATSARAKTSVHGPVEPY